MKKISFVIPVFRNQGSLHPTYGKISELLALLPGYEYELIFIDDGSDDNSLNELKQLRQQDPNCKIVSFSRNFGQVAAVIAGLKQATGTMCIVMSADLQEPIELIQEMVAVHEKGNDIVICHRIDREDSFIANTTSKVFYKLMKMVNPKMPQGGFDFMLLGRVVVDELNKLEDRNRFFQGDIFWVGFTTAFIPYKRLKRTIGKSQWSTAKKIKYFIDGLLNTSYAPIRLMSLLGLIVSLLGFVYAVVIVYLRIMHNTPFEGWAPIMILILVVSGLIMLMLGIIGEYIWRIYDETRGRPIYIVKEKHTD